jgi:hypothetical protein
LRQSCPMRAIQRAQDTKKAKKKMKKAGIKEAPYNVVPFEVTDVDIVEAHEGDVAEPAMFAFRPKVVCV